MRHLRVARACPPSNEKGDPVACVLLPCNYEAKIFVGLYPVEEGGQ